MSVKKNELHLKAVELFEKKKAGGLSFDKQLQLFKKAFECIEKRTLRTLSSITLLVVLDRVLHQSKDKYSLLSELKIDQKGLSFDSLIHNINKHNSEQLIEALRYLMVELLTVLGSITADILSAPLHKELLNVTLDQDNKNNPKSVQDTKMAQQNKLVQKRSERA